MIRLKLSTGKAASIDGNAPGSATTPAPPPTPASAASTGPRLSLKNSYPPAPANDYPGSVTTAKKARQQSQQIKARKNGGGAGGRKRAGNDDTISPAAKRLQNGAGPTRKISLKLPLQALARLGDGAPPSAGGLNKIQLKRRSTAPKLKSLIAKSRPPPRLPGHGYDSEDSEAEDDPAIQQAFILRMQPGEDCDYIRDAIANGKFGLPPSEGPAEVSMRFVDKDFRRAIVTVRGRMYAAVLVDLPCIVETMKSWDKKGWWKVADLCQMLLVLGRCSSDEETKTYPLPREVDKETLQYAHGLTPPMHWVRKRRFRKRLSYKTIANVDEEVERLLREDDEAERQGGQVTFETLTRAELERSQDPEDTGYDEEEDADGEAVETVENGQEYEEYYSDEDDADLEGNLQAMFDAAPTAETLTDSPAPLAEQAASLLAVENDNVISESAAEAETPAETQDTPTQDEQSSFEEEEASDEDDDASEEEEEDSPDVMDEDALAKAAERNQQLAELKDLEDEIKRQGEKAEALGHRNRLLQQSALVQLRGMQEDLRKKRGALGLETEEED